MKRFGILFGAALVSLSGFACAETEDGLYGASVPAGAVFVRVLGEAREPINILGRAVDAAEMPKNVFVAFPASALKTAEPGAHYSIAKSNRGWVTIEEPDRDKKSKVYLSVINVDAGSASLSVAQSGPQLVDVVSAGGAGTRAVNPVSATLSATSDGSQTEFDVVLRRKQNITFVMRAGGIVELVDDTYGPVFEALAQ
ncbi:MAG: hypothetical protein AAF340_07435 [Pseudomonadota bacterium]